MSLVLWAFLIQRDVNEVANQVFCSPGWGYSLYKPYRYVPPHRVGFLRRFGLKTGIHFAHFGLESGMVFEGTTGVYERIYRFNSKWVRKKEKYANRNGFEEFFSLPSNLSNVT